MSDDHDAIEAEFNGIVREFAAERVSRTTSNNITPPHYEPRPLAPARGIVLAVTAVILAAVLVWIVVVVLVATSSPPHHQPASPTPSSANTTY